MVKCAQQRHAADALRAPLMPSVRPSGGRHRMLAPRMIRTTAPTFRFYLKSASLETLRRDLAGLYEALPEVRQYFAARRGGTGEAAAVKRAKEALTREFYPGRGFGKARPSVARAAIAAFSRLSLSPEVTIDVLLHHVELSVRFTNDFGDIGEAFYSSAQTSFRAAAALLKGSSLHTRFHERFRSVVRHTEDIGWGFHDDLTDTYCAAFPVGRPRA
jgi:Family of unknown function (DUF6155)